MKSDRASVTRSGTVHNFSLIQASQISKALFSYGYLDDEENSVELLFTPIKCREYLNEITQQYCGFKRSSEEYVHGFHAGKLVFNPAKKLQLFVGGLSASVRDTVVDELVKAIPDLQQPGFYRTVATGGFLLALPERFYRSGFMMALITNYIRNIERYGSLAIYDCYEFKDNCAGGKYIGQKATLPIPAAGGGAEASFAQNIITLIGDVDKAKESYLTALATGGEELWGPEPDLTKSGGYEIHTRGIVATYRHAQGLKKGIMHGTDKTEPAAHWLAKNWM